MFNETSWREGQHVRLRKGCSVYVVENINPGALSGDEVLLRNISNNRDYTTVSFEGKAFPGTEDAYDVVEIIRGKVEEVQHPQHYGGADNPFEAIKIIRHYSLNFNVGSVVKYILRAGKKGDALTDLKKAEFYVKEEIKRLETTE